MWYMCTCVCDNVQLCMCNDVYVWCVLLQEGLTPLCLAVKAGQLQLVHLLLGKGARPAGSTKVRQGPRNPTAPNTHTTKNTARRAVCGSRQCWKQRKAC
jgi:ankyrin repeat protein